MDAQQFSDAICPDGLIFHARSASRPYTDAAGHHARFDLHADGQSAGNLHLLLSAQRRELCICTLELEAWAQGRGFARALASQLVRRGAGQVTHLALHAGLHGGAYAWARAGFHFADPSGGVRAHPDLRGADGQFDPALAGAHQARRWLRQNDVAERVRAMADGAQIDGAQAERFLARFELGARDPFTAPAQIAGFWSDRTLARAVMADTQYPAIRPLRSG